MKAITKRKFFQRCFFLGILTFLSACACKPGSYKLDTDYGTVYVPTCCPIVEYSKNSFTIKGVVIPITEKPINIGEVTWEP